MIPVVRIDMGYPISQISDSSISYILVQSSSTRFTWDALQFGPWGADPCIVWITFNTICWPIKSTNKYLCSAFKIFNEIFKNTKIRAKLYPRQSPLSQKKKKQRKLLQLNGTSFFIMFIDSVASFYLNTLSCRQHAIVINCLTA